MKINILHSLNLTQLIVKLKMEKKGLKAKDLEHLIGSKGHVSLILSGKRELTLKMAKALRTFFGIPSDIFLSETVHTNH
jgi:HTH-type transcriptional regulator / antitoxin HigA